MGQGMQWNVIDPGQQQRPLGGEYQPQGASMAPLFSALRGGSMPSMPAQAHQAAPPAQAPAVGLRAMMTNPVPGAGTVPGGLSTFSATPPIQGMSPEQWARVARFFA